MKKVKVKIKVNEYIISEKGIIENEILKVNDKNFQMEFNYNSLVFTRKNKDIKIKIDFKNSTLIYEIPESNKKFSNKITILSLTNKNKQYNIKYQMEEEVFNLIIKYETI